MPVLEEQGGSLARQLVIIPACRPTRTTAFIRDWHCTDDDLICTATGRLPGQTSGETVWRDSPERDRRGGPGRGGHGRGQRPGLTLGHGHDSRGRAAPRPATRRLPSQPICFRHKHQVCSQSSPRLLSSRERQFGRLAANPESVWRQGLARGPAGGGGRRGAQRGAGRALCEGVRRSWEAWVRVLVRPCPCARLAVVRCKMRLWLASMHGSVSLSLSLLRRDVCSCLCCDFLHKDLHSLMESARGCPGSTCISPVWLDRCKLFLSLSLSLHGCYDITYSCSTLRIAYSFQVGHPPTLLLSEMVGRCCDVRASHVRCW